MGIWWSRPRAATTTDAFNAAAGETRRDILTALAAGESAVGEVVDRLGLAQLQVSKDLGVLRRVDPVRAGQLNAAGSIGSTAPPVAERRIEGPTERGSITS